MKIRLPKRKKESKQKPIGTEEKELKDRVIKGTDKVIEEYGETLKKLGKS